MEIYTRITDWLKKNPSEDNNEKILKMINQKNRTSLKKDLRQKQKTLDKLMKDITELEKQVGPIVKSRKTK